MATPEQTARRRAQRQLARNLAQGRPTLPQAITKPVRAAQDRLLTGRRLKDAPVGTTGIIHGQRAFGTVAAALRWGQAHLPPASPAFVMVRGILRTASGDRQAGEHVWATVSPWVRARYLTEYTDQAQAEEAALFFTVSRVVLQWRA